MLSVCSKGPDVQNSTSFPRSVELHDVMVWLLQSYKECENCFHQG